jgi:hypothetical protein
VRGGHRQGRRCNPHGQPARAARGVRGGLDRRQRHLAQHPKDWYVAGVATTCRWLANATVRPASSRWNRQWAPVTKHSGSAYEELIEAECLAAETLLLHRPVPRWLLGRPGWLEAIFDTLNWVWRRTAGAPMDVTGRVAG